MTAFRLWQHYIAWVPGVKSSLLILVHWATVYVVNCINLMSFIMCSFILKSWAGTWTGNQSGTQRHLPQGAAFAGFVEKTPASSFGS